MGTSGSTRGLDQVLYGAPCTNYNVQGDLSFLPPPKKTESQTWGEGKNRVQELTHVWDSVFFGGGKKDVTLYFVIHTNIEHV